MSIIEELEARAGVSFFDYQVEAIEWAETLPMLKPRACLYYKTGAGKSITALSMLAAWGWDKAVVITPPSTYAQWVRFGEAFDIEVTCMSHARWRMKDTKVSRNVPVIADEMHMFGTNTGPGWKKLDTLGRHLQAPLIMASATPNYNDAERVYCIQHILDPQGTKGGFLEFVYKHCDTEQNRFSMMPLVTGFKHHANAAEYLSSLDGVHFLPDDLVFQIMDTEVPDQTSPAFNTYGYDERKHRLVASQMEERHTRIFHTLVCPDGHIYDHVYEQLVDMMAEATTPVLIFANHATVALALSHTLQDRGVAHGLVTGSQTANAKEEMIRRFKMGQFEVLVGTAALGTGTDGLDKVSDMLIILDDTPDDAFRRQLIGRIMPRGKDSDASAKRVYRVLQQ